MLLGKTFASHEGYGDDDYDDDKIVYVHDLSVITFKMLICPFCVCVWVCGCVDVCVKVHAFVYVFACVRYIYSTHFILIGLCA